MGTTVSLDLRAAARRRADPRRGLRASSTTSTPGSAPTAPTARSAGWLAASSAEDDASPDVRHVLAACEHLAPRPAARSTRGGTGRDGRLDPSGLRQGLGGRGGRLADRQRRRRATTGSTPAATSSRAARRHPGQPWRVGIRHPGPSRQGGRGAGRPRPGRRDLRHVRARRPHRRPADRAAPARGLRSVTVVGPGLGVHRRLRDRGLRDGARRSRAGSRPSPSDYAALAITDDDRAVWTDGMERYLVREGRAPRSRSRPTAVRGRQADHEAGAALGPVGDLDPAAVALDDPVRRSRGRARSRRRARRAPGRSARRRAAGPPAGCPGRRPRPRATRRSPSARTATPTRPSVGLWRIALSTRIITSWRSRAGSPATTAGCGSTTTRTPRSVAGLPSADAPSAATSPRSTGTRSSATAPESERASSSRSSTIAVMWRTSSSMSSSAMPTSRDRLVAVALEVLDAAPDDGQRRPQLVAGVGGELALAAERDALVRQRLADRHERPAGVDGAEAEGDQDDDDRRRRRSTTSIASSVRCSVDPVLDDLDRVGRRRRWHGDVLGQDADRRHVVGRRSVRARSGRPGRVGAVALTRRPSAMSGRPGGSRSGARPARTALPSVDGQRDTCPIRRRRT